MKINAIPALPQYILWLSSLIVYMMAWAIVTLLVFS